MRAMKRMRWRATKKKQDNESKEMNRNKQANNKN